VTRFDEAIVVWVFRSKPYKASISVSLVRTRVIVRTNFRGAA